MLIFRIAPPRDHEIVRLRRGPHYLTGRALPYAYSLADDGDVLIEFRGGIASVNTDIAEYLRAIGAVTTNTAAWCSAVMKAGARRAAAGRAGA
jgi:hypothetical protein